MKVISVIISLFAPTTTLGLQLTPEQNGLLTAFIDKVCPVSPEPVLSPKLDAEDTYRVDEWMVWHNVYRCLHDTPLLSWDYCVENSAQQWANRGVFEHDGSYNLRPCEGPAGENIASGMKTPSEGVKAYYEWEYPAWLKNPSKTSYVSGTGHFTAMIWAGTTHIGCARGPNRIDVCRYKSKSDKLDCSTPNMASCFGDNIKPRNNGKTVEQCLAIAKEWGLGPDVRYTDRKRTPPSTAALMTRPVITSNPPYVM